MYKFLIKKLENPQTHFINELLCWRSFETAAIVYRFYLGKNCVESIGSFSMSNPYKNIIEWSMNVSVLTIILLRAEMGSSELLYLQDWVMTCAPIFLLLGGGG